jgi:hypothetical protein
MQAHAALHQLRHEDVLPRARLAHCAGATHRKHAMPRGRRSSRCNHQQARQYDHSCSSWQSVFTELGKLSQNCGSTINVMLEKLQHKQRHRRRHTAGVSDVRASGSQIPGLSGLLGLYLAQALSIRGLYYYCCTAEHGIQCCICVHTCLK